MDFLDESVDVVQGVGPKKKESLEKMGIRSLGDLLYHFPRSYEDRRTIKTLSLVEEGDKVSISLSIIPLKKKGRYGKVKGFTQVIGEDSTGRILLTFFNQPYLHKRLKEGMRVVTFGEIKRGPRGLEMINPDFYDAEEEIKEKILPIYPLGNALTQKDFRRFIFWVLNELKERENSDLQYDPLPRQVIEKNKLWYWAPALWGVHYPREEKELRVAKYRLVYEEFFHLMVTLGYAKGRVKEEEGYAYKVFHKSEEFLDRLPFSLTNHQKKVIQEVFRDLKKKTPMNRIIQGDVGSGKTAVAMAALAATVENGYQAGFMVPTEVLAKQHYLTLTKMMNSLNCNVGLLIGSMRPKEKKEIKTALLSGEIDLLIGTHALITEDVKFKNLAFVITDEQHRFGVRQRKSLGGKGKNPHTLVMSATPIPRTLALILYGDLEVSTIEGLPPGRKSISTRLVESGNRKPVYEEIKKSLDQGRQTYVICPLIEESETMDLNAAVSLYGELTENLLKDYKIGLLHGKMTYNEKDRVMKDFQENRLNVLVSTTVIEVGVDVPNATVMVIENSERFGLAQLHQLRGRIGRGEHASTCYLIHDGKNERSLERLKMMEESQDGFKIAEKDLELRGPGEFFGLRQHGVYSLKIGNFIRHRKILKKAQEDVKEVLKEDPKLAHPQNLSLRTFIEARLRNYGG